MVTNNSLNQRSEALVIAPTGVGTPDPGQFTLQVLKNSNSDLTSIISNTNVGNAVTANLYIQTGSAAASLSMQCVGANYAANPGIAGDTFISGGGVTNGMRLQTDLSKKFFFEFGGNGANNLLLTLDDATGKVNILRTASSTTTSPILQWNVDGTDQWQLATNRGASNVLQLAQGGTLGTNVFNTWDYTNGTVTIQKNQNNITSSNVTNTTNGTASVSESVVNFDSGYIAMIGFSSAYSATPSIAGKSKVQTTATNGLDIQSANYPIRIYGTASDANPEVIISSTGGKYKGNNTNTAPAAGFIGEQIRGFLASGSATSLTTGTAKTITSIDLTPGIWDISFVASISAAAGTTTTNWAAGIATTTNSSTGWVNGDNVNGTTLGPTSGVADATLTIPSWRVSLSANTTYYLTIVAVFAVSTMTGYGRISATRVA